MENHLKRISLKQFFVSKHFMFKFSLSFISIPFRLQTDNATLHTVTKLYPKGKYFVYILLKGRFPKQFSCRQSLNL